MCPARANNHNEEIFLSLLTCGVLIGSHTITEQKFYTKMTYASLSEVSLPPVGKSSHTQGLPAAYCNGHQELMIGVASLLVTPLKKILYQCCHRLKMLICYLTLSRLYIII